MRKQNQAFYEFMVPLVKGYSTEMSLEVTSLGVQVHGGMGFIEETGAAQYYRDAKILTIYEGTTAIQANDLVGRKTARDGGQTAKAHRRADRAAPRPSWPSSDSAAAQSMLKRLRAAREAFVQVVDFVAGNTKASPNAVFAGSVPYLMLAGNLMAGWQLARALLVAEEQLAQGEGDAAFLHGQGRHRALLRRAPPEQGAGRARHHRRRRRERHGAGARRVLNLAPNLGDPSCPCRPILAKLPLPIIGSPLFIISNPKLVIEQCKAGIVGSMPALNARPAAQLDEWLAEITETLAAYDRAQPGQAGRAVRDQPDRAQEQRPARARHAGLRQVQGADHHHLAGRAHRRQRGGARLGRHRAARHHQQQLRAARRSRRAPTA